MAHETDHYTVETEYTVKDGSSFSLARIEKGFKALEHSTERLRERFNEFGRELRGNTAALLGIGFGIGAVVEKTKEATASFEEAQDSVQALVANTMQWPKALTPLDRWNASAKLSAETTEALEDTVRDYGGSLTDAVAGFKELTATVSPMKLTQEELIGLYQKVSASAKAAGISASQAADIVGKAILTGNVRASRETGQLGVQLYQALHAHAKLVKSMNGTQRLGLVEKALGDQEAVAKAMSKNWDDSWRKVAYDIEKLVRRVGGPLFERVERTLLGWSKAIEKAEVGSRPLLNVWGDKLVSAFETIQSASGFIVDHWKVLAGIWASFKVGSMANGIGGGLAGIAAAVGGNIGGAMGLFGKGLSGMAGAMGPVVLGLGAFKLALDAVIGWIEAKVDKHREIVEHGQFSMGDLQTLQHLPAMGPLSKAQENIGRGIVKDLVKTGALGAGGQFDRSAAAINFSRMGGKELENVADALGIRTKGLPVSAMAASQFADAFASKLAPILSAHPELLPGYKQAEAAASIDTKNLKTKGVQIGPFTGAITINQKFDDVDPDRVWVTTLRGIQENAERPVQSAYSAAFGG